MDGRAVGVHIANAKRKGARWHRAFSRSTIRAALMAVVRFAGRRRAGGAEMVAESSRLRDLGFAEQSKADELANAAEKAARMMSL